MAIQLYPGEPATSEPPSPSTSNPWGILVIAADIAVIWALTAHGRDIQKAERM